MLHKKANDQLTFTGIHKQVVFKRRNGLIIRKDLVTFSKHCLMLQICFL